MKVMTYRLYILLVSSCLFFWSCDDTSWKDEISSIKTELQEQSQLITKLQSNKTIYSISNETNGYTIHLSDGSSYSLKDGVTPLIEIGSNNNWYINGKDTEVKAIGTDGVDAVAPTLNINSDGYWVINDSVTDTKALGQDGTNAPDITSIIETDTRFLVYLSNGTCISTLKNNIVMAWGDSLTQGQGHSYTSFLQELLGSDYTIINAGNGGESTYTIAARQGGSPMTFDRDITIPSTLDSVVVTLNNYYGCSINPLYQGSAKSINPCYIDGIECTLIWTGTWYGTDGVYKIRRNKVGETHVVAKGTPVITNYMKNYRSPYCLIVWMGANGIYTDSNDLIDQIKSMIEYSGVSRYIVIGYHYSKGLELNEPMKKAFGAKFLDWNSIIIKNGFADANITPTHQDSIDALNGICPASFRRDAIHLSDTGYSLLAKYLYTRMKDLGY